MHWVLTAKQSRLSSRFFRAHQALKPGVESERAIMTSQSQRVDAEESRVAPARLLCGLVDVHSGNVSRRIGDRISMVAVCSEIRKVASGVSIRPTAAAPAGTRNRAVEGRILNPKVLPVSAGPVENPSPLNTERRCMISSILFPAKKNNCPKSFAVEPETTR